MTDTPTNDELSPQADLGQLLLSSGFNIVLQMPTGSGKTHRAAAAIRETCLRGHKAIYVTPTKALANELYERWAAEWPTITVGVFTGDFGKNLDYPVSFAAAQVLIMTPERLDLCTRQWRHHWTWIPRVDMVVIDEIHLLGDEHRGPRLEGAITRLRALNPFARVVGLSATLGNPHQLAAWLDGIAHVSTQRPIETTWRTELFSKADQKPAKLLDALAPNLARGGKTIVFVQSKRRAEQLTCFLASAGVAAEHHHGGLSFEQRKDKEVRFRAKAFDVLVATGTLEVGLNLPVSQVVLYDMQHFNGTEFLPLSVISVWQRAGRAGRPGLQVMAEVVMFRARWEKDLRYAEGRFEDIRSSLHKEVALCEQVIVNVSSGYARTRSELKALAETTLAHCQVKLMLDKQIDAMRSAGFLLEEFDEKRGVTRIKATPLGRACNRLMLGPATASQLARALSQPITWTHFDLLLICACLPDIDLAMTVDFEELDAMGLLLNQQRSHLLTSESHRIGEVLCVAPKRLLSGVKAALVLKRWTLLGDEAQVAEEMGCYVGDVHRAMDAMNRLLNGALAVVDDLVSRDPEGSMHLAPVKQRLKRLLLMVGSGLDHDAVTLTLVDGVGAVWARKLKSNGMDDIEALAQAELRDVVGLGGISADRAQRWIDQAAALLSSDQLWDMGDVGSVANVTVSDWDSELDIYRYRRSLQLSVVMADDGQTWNVSGGTDPHQVIMREHLHCDCQDHAKGHVCKHLMAVMRHQQNPDILALDAQFASAPHIGNVDLHRWWLQ